jgi:hypothetical protein
MMSLISPHNSYFNQTRMVACVVFVTMGGLKTYPLTLVTQGILEFILEYIHAFWNGE